MTFLRPHLKDAKPRFSVASLTLLFVLSVCLVILGLEVSRILEQRAEALDAGRTDTANLVMSLTQHAELTFRATDAVLAGLVERLEIQDQSKGEAAGRLRRWFHDEVERLPQLLAFSVSDQNGAALIISSQNDWPNISVSDREFFRYHQNRNDQKLYIGSPIFGKTLLRWLIPISRRYNSDDGSFGGVATAFLDVDYFQKFYDQFDVGANGAILLMSENARLMVRRPFVEANIGRDMSQSNIAKAIQLAPFGSSEITASTDGVKRLNSYRRSEQYPVVVAVAMSTDGILSAWRSRSIREFAATLSLLLMIAVGGFFISEMARKLAIGNYRFDTAINNMKQGLCLFDADQKVIVSNLRYAEIYQLSCDQVRPGTPLRQILESRRQHGTNHTVSADVYLNASLSVDNEIQELADGRSVAISRRRMPHGGWLTVHEDITQRVAVEGRLKESEARYRLLADNSSDMVFELDRDLKRRYVSPACRELLGFEPEEMVGVKPVTMAHPEDAERVTVAFQAVLSGELDRNSVTNRISCHDGSWIWVEAQIRALKDSETGKITGIIGALRDISARKAAEEELFQQAMSLARTNMQFEAALENMSQGLCLFDKNEKVLVSNAKIAEIYRLDPDQIKPGTTNQQLGEFRQERGTLVIRTGGIFEDPGINEGDTTEELADGRFVAITKRRMPDGGWVATHEDVTERVQNEKRIAFLAHHDQLTGLVNRAFFAEKLGEAAKRLARSATPFSVFMLDLDKFKYVNDTLGHPAGDQLLLQVAQRLKSSLREADIVARLGGDEFAILQEGENNPREGAIGLALRIIDIISAPFDLNGNQANIGTSIGIALAPECGVDAETLLKKADLALYQAKSDGRNDYRMFRPEMAAASDTQKILESELREAVHREEFVLHYQPVVDAKTGSMCAAEALVRWQHPTRGLVFPDQFIPLAESTGLMMRLGEWILQRACQDAASWPSHIKVAINISAVQFNNASLFDLVLCALVESGLAPERLELEITETMLLKDEQACLLTIRQLKNLGIAIVLDDFGIGYSSSSRLTRVPFDKIKIDKSFVQGFPNRRECSAIIQSVLALARGLDMAITAEGVETREQFEALRLVGVDLVQGYFFGRPVALHEFNWSDVSPQSKNVA